jgi:hypothetical protein
VRSALTGDDLFASLMMMHSLDGRSVIVVESSEDCAVLDAHLDQFEASTLPGYGKRTVFRTVELIDEHQVDWAVGVVDRDFDSLFGHMPESDNLVYTDAYDLLAEMLRYFPGVAERAIVAHSEREKRLAYTGSPIADIRSLTTSIGALRFCSVLFNWQLRLNDFPIQESWVQNSSSDETRRSVVEFAVLRTASFTRVSVDAADLAVQIASLGFAFNTIANSHDFSGVAAAFLRRRLGGTIGRDNLEDSLRASLDCASFQSLPTIERLSAWSRQRGLSELWTCD